MSNHQDNRRRRVKHAETEKFLDAVRAEMIEREPRVTALTAWLEARKGQNGFGDDFELTLTTPRRPA